MRFVMDNNKFIVFLNKKIDFDNKLKLEKKLKEIIKEIQIKYNTEFDGYYNADFYFDKNYGIIIEFEKEEFEYYNYLNQIDMELNIYKTDFFYEIDYIYLDKKILDEFICYKYKEKLYLKAKENISQITLCKVLEISRILYNKNKEQIIKYGKKVNI